MQKRRIRLSVCAAAVLFVCALVVLFVRPPRAVLGLMMQVSSGWLMADDDGAIKRVCRTYLQTAVASHLADQILDEPGSDEDRLLEMMLVVRKSVVSVRADWQLNYNPADWPALIAGVGYCDQVNGAVATVAVQHFPKAELIALYLSAEHWSPHTIGRVWSEQRGEWLYFDAFYRDAVIFTKDARGRIHMLRSASKLTRSTRDAAPPGIYTLDVWKLTEFRSTFGMQVIQRVRQRILPESVEVEVADAPSSPAPSAPVPTPVVTKPAPPPQTAEKPPAPPPAVAEAPPAPPRHEVTRSQKTEDGWVFPNQKASRTLTGTPFLKPDPAPVFPGKVDDDLYRRVVREYAKARVMHLLGKPDRDAYRHVAASGNASGDDRAAEIVATARRFAERPEL